MFFFEFAIDEISHPVKLKENAALKKQQTLTHPWRRQNGEEEKSS